MVTPTQNIPDFGSGGQKETKATTPKLSPVRQALKDYKTMSHDLYKFPEPAQTPVNRDKQTALNTAGNEAFASSSPSRKIVPTPLTEQYVPVSKEKDWNSRVPSVSRTGFYLPWWPISTGYKFQLSSDDGQKGYKFWKKWQSGRNYLSYGMVGDSIDKQSGLKGTAKAMRDTIKSEAQTLQSAEKAEVLRNIDLEAKAQKQKLMSFYFGKDAATVDDNNQIKLLQADRLLTPVAINEPQNKNYKTLCETYDLMPLPTETKDQKEDKQRRALAIIAQQCAAIDANAQRLKENVDTFHQTEQENLDKELKAKKDLELENLYTRRVNALKKDPNTSGLTDPVLKSIDENGKVPESNIKDFKIDGYRVTEEVDQEGNKGFKFHRPTAAELKKEAEKTNVLSPLGIPRLVGTIGATAFMGLSTMALVVFTGGLAIPFINWKQRWQSLKEDWGKLTVRLPFAETRRSWKEKKAFDKFLDVLIKPGHTWVRASEDTTPAERRQLWLKAQTINPGMKVYIGKNEYMPTAADVKKLAEVQAQMKKQKEQVYQKSVPETRTKIVDDLIAKGRIEEVKNPNPLNAGDEYSHLTEKQQKQVKFVQDFREWVDTNIDADDKQEFMEWWYEKGGQKNFEDWNDSLARKFEGKTTSLPGNENKDKLDKWLDKQGQKEFDEYKQEQQSQSLTSSGPSS